MINANVNEGKTQINVCGSIPTVCSDVSHIIEAIVDALQEQDNKTAHIFMEMFAAGFLKGIPYGIEKAEMQKILDAAHETLQKAEKAEKEKKENKDTDEIADAIKQIQELKEAVPKEVIDKLMEALKS